VFFLIFKANRLILDVFKTSKLDKLIALFSFLLQALALKRIGPERASENKENEVENKKKTSFRPVP